MLIAKRTVILYDSPTETTHQVIGVARPGYRAEEVEKRFDPFSQEFYLRLTMVDGAFSLGLHHTEVWAKATQWKRVKEQSE